MLFYELLQVALGTREGLSRRPTDWEWEEMYRTAAKQSLLGVTFSAIEQLNAADASVKAPLTLFCEWLGEVAVIEQQNKDLNEAASQLYRIFENGGLRSCVLKGQGIARLYPVPERRQPGDIDLWVEGSRENTLKFLRESFFGIGRVVIHHVDAHIIEGVETEIHFMPGYTYSPFRHRRIQCYFREQADAQFRHYDSRLGFCYPTGRFNAVYILSHIFMHFLYEGVGLRQVVDYFYVLKSLREEERTVAAKDICAVGLRDFAGAVMFVLKVVCGMRDSYLTCKPDDSRGKVLLEEIMRGGNFGRDDVRVTHSPDDGVLRKNIRRIKREMSFFRYYPVDVASVPFWKLWHWCWRKRKGFLGVKS